MARVTSLDWTPPALLPPAVLDRVLDGALSAFRVGALEKLCQQRERATRWCLRRLAGPLAWFDPGVTGDQGLGRGLGWMVEVALRWAVLQLRPDGLPTDTPIPAHAWAGAAAWRPMLALACHYTLLPVEGLPQRYRPRPGEPAFEHICGLWDIAPSSFYRYVERGRQLLALELSQPLSAQRALSLAAYAHDACGRRLGQTGAPQAQRQWHRECAAALLRDARTLSSVGALWHTARTGDPSAALSLIDAHSLGLAASPLTDAVLAELDVGDADSALRVRLALARANLAQIRGDLPDEQAQLALALRHAVAIGEPGWLGTVYAARARCSEARNPDRAMADYREAASHFEQALAAMPHGHADGANARHGLLGALVGLAEQYLLRNDPRAAALLERADGLAAEAHAPVDLRARLQLTRGEYWQRQGDLDQAIEVTHHALQLCERAGHQRRVVSAWGRLAMQYGYARDIDRALHYARLVDSVRDVTPLAPETVAAIQLNIGIAYFWKDRLDEAIEHYRHAARIAQDAGLQTIAGKAHFNLAEACFTRFQRDGDPQDEVEGDAYARRALSVWESQEGARAEAEATRNLKRTVLGDREHLVYNRLLPAELAAHFDEMKEVERQRHRLESSGVAEERVAAHFAIAQAYLRIAVAEREAAVALARQQGLAGSLTAPLQALRDTFDRALSDGERRAARWEQAGVIPREHVPILVRLLSDKQPLTKSVCAQACSVSPATASKYLADLTVAGLLTRVGKGPATHYRPT
jgi:tetratricopeptide (TPR) repeat protein